MRELDKELVTGDRGKCDRHWSLSLISQIVTFRSDHVSFNEGFKLVKHVFGLQPPSDDNVRARKYIGMFHEKDVAFEAVRS